MIEDEIKDWQSACYGLHGYSISAFENLAEGNVYYGGARPGETDTLMLEVPGYHPAVELQEKEDGVFLELDFDGSLDRAHTEVVTTRRLGMTIVSEAVFELPDGSPYRILSDYSGSERDGEAPKAGPIETLGKGKQVFRVWY